MKNAHERFGWLEFDKPLKDTKTRIRVALDRFIGENSEDKEASGVAHVISVFGSDVDIGAIWAAVAGQELLTVSGPGLQQRRVSLGKDPRIFPRDDCRSGPESERPPSYGTFHPNG